jgi:hypothetical protein
MLRLLFSIIYVVFQFTKHSDKIQLKNFRIVFPAPEKSFMNIDKVITLDSKCVIPRYTMSAHKALSTSRFKLVSFMFYNVMLHLQTGCMVH